MKKKNIQKIISMYRLTAYKSTSSFVKTYCYKKADELERLVNKNLIIT